MPFEVLGRAGLGKLFCLLTIQSDPSHPSPCPSILLQGPEAEAGVGLRLWTGASEAMSSGSVQQRRFRVRVRVSETWIQQLAGDSLAPKQVLQRLQLLKPVVLRASEVIKINHPSL